METFFRFKTQNIYFEFILHSFIRKVVQLFSVYVCVVLCRTPSRNQSRMLGVCSMQSIICP